MLSRDAAVKMVVDLFPKDVKITGPIEYKNLFVFLIIGSDEMEGDQDPFYSVNRTTSELRDFSILTDGDPNEIERLFLALESNE